jgi:hypothetical protein
MAIEAHLSKYKKNNFRITLLLLIGFGIWFAYDGYFNEDFIKKNTNNYGTPEAAPNNDLIFNQRAPFFLFGTAVVVGVWFFLVRDKKLVVGEDALVTEKYSIAYNSIEKIDKTYFESKGYFVVTYKDNEGKEARLKLSDRSYDNLPAVLDELVAKIS